MGSKDKGTIQETPEQAAMKQMAVQKFNDYKQRWLPVQQQLASHIQSLSSESSPLRQRGIGAATAEQRAKFGQAQEDVQKRQVDTGAGIGSGRFNMAVTGLGSDEAQSTGLNTDLAERQIDAQYLGGLTDLMKMGQGQSAHVSTNMANVADISGRTAAADAEQAAAARAGRAQFIGSVVGSGVGYARGQYGGGSGGGVADAQQDLQNNMY